MIHERKYINQISAVRDQRGSPREKLLPLTCTEGALTRYAYLATTNRDPRPSHSFTCCHLIRNFSLAHRNKRIQSDGRRHGCPRTRGQPGAELEGCPTHHGADLETEGEPQSRGLVHQRSGQGVLARLWLWPHGRRRNDQGSIAYFINAVIFVTVALAYFKLSRNE